MGCFYYSSAGFFFSESDSNSNHQCYHFAILKMYYDFFVIVCVALTCSRKLNIIMTWTIIIFIIKLTRQRKRKCCDKLQRSVRRGEESWDCGGQRWERDTGTGRSASSMLSSGGLLLFIVSKQMVYSLIYIMCRCLMWRTKQPSIYTRWVQSSMLYRCYWIRGTDEDVDHLRIVKLNFFLKKCWSV